MRRFVFLLLVVVLGPQALANPSQAQTSIAPPAPYEPVDAFGVDLSNGKFSASTTTISVGPPDGGLSYQARSAAGTYAWRHSTAGGVDRRPVTGTGSNYPVYTVTVMGQSAAFISDGAGGFQLQDGVGVLTFSGGDYIYTAPDGSVATIDKSLSTLTPYAANEGQIVSLLRPNGEQITFTYNANDQIQAITNNLGNQIHFDYSATNANIFTKVTAFNMAVDYCAPTSATCVYSQTWPSLTFAEVRSGTVVTQRTVTDSLGRQMRLLYGGGTLTGVARPTKSSGANLSLTWSQGKVRTVSDGAGTWTYSFEQGPPTRYETTTTVDGPGALLTNYTFDWFDVGEFGVNFVTRLKSITDANGVKTDIIQGAAGLARVTFPEGDGYSVNRNEWGNVTSVRHWAKPGSGLADTTVTATYPSACTSPVLCRRPVTMTDERGNVTDFTWDAAGNLLTSTSPAPTPGAVRPQIRSTWQQRYAWFKSGPSTISQAATPVWVQIEKSACATLGACDASADEVLTTTTYQAGSASTTSNLLPVSVSGGSGNGTLTATTTTTYDGVGNVLTVNSPLAGTADTTRYVWDAMRQAVGVIGPDPDGTGSRLYPATRTTYNADGQATMVERGTTPGQTDANWSAFSALQTATAAYDTQGRKILDIAAAGSADAMATQYTYDSAGRLTCSTVRMNPAQYGSLPASACTLGAQGSFGPDRITYNTYDAVSRLLSTTSGYLSGTTITESQTWTSNGKVATRTDGNGNLSTYVYDGFDRLVQLRYPNASGGGSSTTDYEAWAYDPSGNVVSRRNRGGETFAQVWDALNRKTLTDAPAGVDNVSYAYDNLSRQRTATAGGQTLTSTWDALSRLTSAAGPLGTVGYGYDLAGRRTSITWPDGFWAQYAYDNTGAVTSVSEYGTGQLFSWVYDNLGRIYYTGRGNGVTTIYGYDTASRVSSLTHDLPGTANDLTLSFTYNPAGQIATRTMSNTAYAYTPGAGSTGYVNNGKNQVTAVGSAGFSYDGRGNITQIGGTNTQTYDGLNQLTAANTTSGWLGMSYDPSGRLYQTTDGGGAATRFLYDGVQAIGEYNTSGGLLRRYVPGVGLDSIVTAYEGSGTTDRRYPLSDERQSVISITNGSAGVIATNTYDEYGVPGAGNSGRFQYTGQMWLPEAQLYHYRARAYAPTLGRFLQTDPIGYDDGLNLYAYVANDPVNATDPSGNSGLRIFVETAKGGWRRLRTEIQAVRARQAGRNVRVDGNGPRSGTARRIEEQASGRKNTTRHDPHADGQPGRQGTERPHYQPSRRASGAAGRGHTFYSAAAAEATNAAAAMDDVANEIGTWEDKLKPDATDSERRVAQALDFIDPASNIADTLRLVAEGVRAVTPEP